MRSTGRRWAVRGVIASAACAAAVAAGHPAAADGDGDSVAAGLPSAREIVAQRFADLTPGRAEALARANGRMRLTGRVHLAGRVFAEAFEVAPGAQVTLASGTTIYSLGDVHIAAPLVMLPPAAPRKAAAGGKVGANGADAIDLIITCAQGDATIDAIIQVGDGGDGESVLVDGTSGQGGDGGDGAGILIDCPGTVTINANLAPGRGGAGGDAHVIGADGAAGENGETVKSACGGKGGKSGNIRILAHKAVFAVDVSGKPTGKIALRPGGEGGLGWAEGGKGGPAAGCFQPGGTGGGATAVGGAAGAGTDALLDVDELEPVDLDAHDVAGFDETESAEGGNGVASGGDGGDAMVCQSAPCPAKGKTGGKGGKGGPAFANGGRGGTGGMIGGGRGVLRIRTPAQAASPPGGGGNADAFGGRGGAGVDGETANAPGKGGAGGAGGLAQAIGGAGGPSRFRSNYRSGVSDDPGPLKGGHGGNVVANGGFGGASGSGGDCCDNPAGRGAAPGTPGKGGKAIARGGAGGVGPKPGDDGSETESPGLAGNKGGKGADCPAFVTDTMTLVSTLAARFAVNQLTPLGMTFTNSATSDVEVQIEVCCDGRSIGRFKFTVPKASLAGPGVGMTAFNLFISSPHESHRISIMIDGKTVKNHYAQVF